MKREQAKGATSRYSTVIAIRLSPHWLQYVINYSTTMWSTPSSRGYMQCFWPLPVASLRRNQIAECYWHTLLTFLEVKVENSVFLLCWNLKLVHASTILPGTLYVCCGTLNGACKIWFIEQMCSSLVPRPPPVLFFHFCLLYLNANRRKKKWGKTWERG